MKLTRAQRDILDCLAKRQGGEVNGRILDALFKKGLVTSAYLPRLTEAGARARVPKLRFKPTGRGDSEAECEWEGVRYRIWIQQRPLDDSPWWAAAVINPSGEFHRDGGRAIWLIDSGTRRDAVDACQRDAERRAVARP